MWYWLHLPLGQMDELPGISSSIQPGWKPRSTAGWKSHVLIHLQLVHFPIELCVLYVYYCTSRNSNGKKTINKQQNPWTAPKLGNSHRPHSSYFLFLQLYIAMIVASNRRSNSFFSSSTSTMGRGRWKTCSGNLDFQIPPTWRCQHVLGDSFCSKHDIFSIFFPYSTAHGVIPSLQSTPWAPC